MNLMILLFNFETVLSFVCIDFMIHLPSASLKYGWKICSCCFFVYCSRKVLLPLCFGGLGWLIDKQKYIFISLLNTRVILLRNKNDLHLIDLIFILSTWYIHSNTSINWLV